MCGATEARTVGRAPSSSHRDDASTQKSPSPIFSASHCDKLPSQFQHHTEGHVMINWIYYPKSTKPIPLALQVVDAFQQGLTAIDSSLHELPSNAVLAAITSGLLKAGFQVEIGKKALEKISVPVLFGINGRLEKSFEADAYHEQEGFVVEVEAGRGVVNNQFLKDLFQACMMHDVKYLAIAVRNIYRGSNDFERVVRFFDTLYASNRLKLPLEGILIIGY